MIFKNKLEKIFKAKHISVDKEEQDKIEPVEKFKLEKNDGIALFLAAFIVFVPVLIVIVGIIMLLVWLFVK